MSFIGPTEEQVKQFSELPDEGPLVMLNLLKFKPEGGAESYARYGEVSGRMINEMGGRIIYFGQYKMPLIGDEDWDAIALVEYPSRASFLKMIGNEEYQEAAKNRTNALLDSRLFVTNPIQGFNIDNNV